MIGRSAQEIRQLLLAKREKQLEESKKRKEGVIQASQAVEDLHILGLGFDEIERLSGVSNGFLREIYEELNLKAPQITVPTTNDIVAIQSVEKVSIENLSRPSSAAPEADTFGAPRWANGLTVDLSDSEYSSEEQEDIKSGEDEDSMESDEVKPTSASVEAAVVTDSTASVPQPHSIVELEQPLMQASNKVETKDVEAEIQRVRMEIKQLQAKNEAKRAAKASQDAVLATLGAQFQQLLLRKEATSRRLHGLDLPKLNKKIARLTSRLAGAKVDLKKKLEEEAYLTTELSEIVKGEEALRSQMFAAHMAASKPLDQAETEHKESDSGPTQAPAQAVETIDAAEPPPEPVQAVDYEDVDMPDDDAYEPDEPDLLVHDDIAPSQTSETSRESFARSKECTVKVPESPLQMFSSWRFSYENIGKPGRCFSSTFNSRFVPGIEDKVFCVTEASGKPCLKRKDCEYVHAEDFNTPAMKILQYMSSCTMGENPNDFRKGLHEYIDRKRKEPKSGNVNLSEQVARWVIEYRKSVDPTRFLDWNGWSNIKGDETVPI